MDELIELEKELLENAEISKSLIRSEFEDSHNADFDDQDRPDFESQVNDKFKKLKKLIALFGENVFHFDDTTLTIQLSPKFKAKKEYLLCLHCMEKQNESTKEISELFEKIVGEALKNYLGENAKYKLVDIEPVIDIEEFCKTDLLETPHRNAQKTFKNKEMTPRCDLIVWKNIGVRMGKVILLIQCKSGKNWRKGHPVNLDLWKTKIIRFLADPIKVFAITDLLEASEISNRSDEKGLIIDRAGIIKWLANAETNSIKDIRHQIEQFI